MSWAETKMINSDFANEPLNYNNYINDISVFGAESYVMDASNYRLWRELISKSLTLFGHSAIHEYVYARLTDDDVDYMILHNKRLGQALNSFYGAAGTYADGGIDAILSGITPEKYNGVEIKLQSGITRYITAKTAGDDAAAWLLSVFPDVAALGNYTTMESIISDGDFLAGTVFGNTALMTVICNSFAAIDWAVNLTGDAFDAFVAAVATSTTATMQLLTLLDSAGRLGEYMSNAAAVTAMTSNEASMRGIMYHAAGLAAMIGDAGAMEIASASEVAVSVLIDAITNTCSSEVALNNINGALGDIDGWLADIPDADADIDEVESTVAVIGGCLDALRATTSLTGVLIDNIAAVLASETAMTAVAASETAMAAVLASETAMTAVAASETAMTAVANSSTARAAIEASSTAISALSASPLAASWSAKSYADTDDTGTDDVYLAKKMWVISATRSSSDGTMTIYYLGGGNTSYTTGGTTKVSRFCSKINGYDHSSSGSVTFSAAYIPCE